MIIKREDVVDHMNTAFRMMYAPGYIKNRKTFAKNRCTTVAQYEQDFEVTCDALTILANYENYRSAGINDVVYPKMMEDFDCSGPVKDGKKFGVREETAFNHSIKRIINMVFDLYEDDGLQSDGLYLERVFGAIDSNITVHRFLGAVVRDIYWCNGIDEDHKPTLKYWSSNDVVATDKVLDAVRKTTEHLYSGCLKRSPDVINVFIALWIRSKIRMNDAPSIQSLCDQIQDEIIRNGSLIHPTMKYIFQHRYTYQYFYKICGKKCSIHSACDTSIRNIYRNRAPEQVLRDDEELNWAIPLLYNKGEKVPSLSVFVKTVGEAVMIRYNL